MQEYEVMYHRTIAANIKKLRKNAKLSQEQFAEKLNCSREFVSRVENLKEKVSLKKAIDSMHQKRINNKDSFGTILTNSLTKSINTLLLILGVIKVCLVITTIIDNNLNLSTKN